MTYQVNESIYMHTCLFQTKVLEEETKVPSGADVSGQCEEKSRDLTLKWGDGVYSMSIHFAVNVSITQMHNYTNYTSKTEAHISQCA